MSPGATFFDGRVKRETDQRGTALREYPRFITPALRPFDPLELARETEAIVCEGDRRKYTDFYATGVYGGIATGYACGCCLRCVFCWVGWSRDFPERYGRFHSPGEAFAKLREAAKRAGVDKLRVSGAEPTIGKQHLLPLLEHVERSEFSRFVLETNGILFGADPDYVRSIAEFRKPHVRLSLKAGTPEAFTRKTGARKESFELPFKAIRTLLDSQVSFHVAAMTADPRITTWEERQLLVERLAQIDPGLVRGLEEEVVDPYDTTLARLEYARCQLEWPLKAVHSPLRPPR